MSGLLRFVDVSALDVVRLLRPHEAAALRRAQAEEARAAAALEAGLDADMDAEEDAAGDATEAEAQAAAAEAEAAAAEEEAAAEQAAVEQACDDPADEAERRATIVRECIFGEGAEDGTGDAFAESSTAATPPEHGVDAQRTAVLVDFLVGCVHFAETNGFSDEQVSIVFAIAKRVFSFARSGGDGGSGGGLRWAPREAAFAEFAAMVRHHAQPDADQEGRRPFSATNVDAVTRFFATTFFRHYNAYELAFTSERSVAIDRADVVVQTPMLVPSLSGAEEVPMAAESKEEASKSDAGLLDVFDGGEDDADKQAALDAAEEALVSLDGAGGKSTESGGSKVISDDGLDERLERHVNERVRQETKALEDKLQELRDAAEALADLED